LKSTFAGNVKMFLR